MKKKQKEQPQPEPKRRGFGRKKAPQIASEGGAVPARKVNKSGINDGVVTDPKGNVTGDFRRRQLRDDIQY